MIACVRIRIHVQCHIIMNTGKYKNVHTVYILYEHIIRSLQAPTFWVSPRFQWRASECVLCNFRLHFRSRTSHVRVVCIRSSRFMLYLCRMTTRFSIVVDLLSHFPNDLLLRNVFGSVNLCQMDAFFRILEEFRQRR